MGEGLRTDLYLTADGRKGESPVTEALMGMPYTVQK